jgi:LmbE family N-acetylglucosaminyl deacetylase
MNIIMFGAHPDDCELSGGGTAVRFARAGHRVKLVSVTNGDAGHQSLKPRELARIRRGEAQAAAAALGVASEVLDNHDGRLVPTVELRERLMALQREWRADVVVSHRPNGYHPDHRAVGQAVQDTAYMAIVPLFCPRVSALPDHPIYLHFWDRLQSPEPFRADVIVPIDDVLERKLEALHRMPSQMYEWLPWTMHALDRVPGGEEGRKAFIREFFLRQHQAESLRREIARRYGTRIARGVEFYEAFHLCEYGRQPTPAELHALFPGLPPRLDLRARPRPVKRGPARHRRPESR